MIDIKKHFGNTAESKEILEDIENRIAEMFSEHIQSGRKEVLNIADVQEVIKRMGKVSDFQESEEYNDGFEEPVFPGNVSTPHTGRKLMRDPDDKIIGGVCSGLAHYFVMEPRWIRLLLVLFVLIGGSGILVYVILWIVMPEAETRADKMVMRGEVPNLENFKKSFDEEVNSFSDNFTGAGYHITRGARTAGAALGGCLGLIGKLIAWVMLLVSGSALVGLFIFYVFNLMNLFGMENPMMFPPLQVLSTDEAVIALTFGFLAITIPILALFLWLIRVLFKAEKLNNYISLTIFAAWIVSIVAVIYFCVSAAQDFREKSTINVERKIEVQKIYSFSEKDVRVLDENEKDSLKSRFNMEMDGLNLRKRLHSSIGIHFESIDSLSQPFIQYQYSAKGKSYQLAAQRAGEIFYQGIQEGEAIVFPSHFLLRNKSLDRDQFVKVIVYLPRGAKVLLDKTLDNKVRDISIWDCRNNYSEAERQKVTEWTMSDRGLVCSQAEPEPEPEQEQDTHGAVGKADQQQKVVDQQRKDSVINIEAPNVTIEMKDNSLRINTNTTQKENAS
ncbi:hypothetical protein FM107_11480 [Sphingobacterium sp. JB170]|nr:hypothetical protein FM107_11480 [Sphingobacterium sp. JB170]